MHLKRFTTHFQNGRFTSQKNKTVVKSENSVTLDPCTDDATKRGDSYELRELFVTLEIPQTLVITSQMGFERNIVAIRGNGSISMLVSHPRIMLKRETIT